MLLSQTREFENRSPLWVNTGESATSSLSKTVLKWYSQSAPASMSFDSDTAPQRDFSMLIGYARVSTQDQNLELQTEALTKAGCKKIFEDKVTGSRAERPGLTKAQEALREGDTLVVWKLDRLGRSVKNLVDLVGELHKEGAQFQKPHRRDRY